MWHLQCDERGMVLQFGPGSGTGITQTQGRAHVALQRTPLARQAGRQVGAGDAIFAGVRRLARRGAVDPSQWECLQRASACSVQHAASRVPDGATVPRYRRYAASAQATAAAGRRTRLSGHGMDRVQHMARPARRSHPAHPRRARPGFPTRAPLSCTRLHSPFASRGLPSLGTLKTLLEARWPPPVSEMRMRRA